MSLIEKVTETITHTLTIDLAEYLADHYGLDSNDVAYQIKCYLGNNSTPVSPAKRVFATKPTIKIKQCTSGEKKCIFEITRGPKANQTCNTNIRGTGNYCSKHKNRKTAN